METIIKNKKTRKLFIIILISIAAAVLTWAAPVKSVEYWFSDLFFVRQQNIDNRIKIIGIDEKSLQEMGPFPEWTRQQAADLLKVFDTEYSPAVVAFDINYFGERDKKGDSALAEYSKRFENVVMASHINFSTKLELNNNGDKTVNNLYIERIERPYEELAKVSHSGFTNVVQDEDNYVRRSYKAFYDENGRENYNFAYEIYRVYKELKGEAMVEPKTDKNGIYGFDYTTQQGIYEIYSYTDVLNGRCDLKAFRDSIVFVGAYSSGMMDQYLVPISKGTVMNGVEVQANHLNALLDERTFIEVPALTNAFITALIIGIFIFLIINIKIPYGVISGIVFILTTIIMSLVLYKNGIYWRCWNVVLCVFFITLIKIVHGYFQERINQMKILDMFRKYIAPQVVDELAKNKDFHIELGGITKDVAVLFIDIRGFSSMSEIMPPEKVIEVLNKYFDLVTNAIFNNEGMLDKFIGDAVMAVYNAPLDIKDYEKKAVQTGLDIVKALNKLNKELREEQGMEIACGIGIHCGKAVVGNIGCAYRMDYTVIGDTVNIAERLEGIARGGVINISQEVYDRVKDNFSAKPKGACTLKGKRKEVMVYEMEAAQDESGNS